MVKERGWSEGAMCVELTVLRGQVVCLYWSGLRGLNCHIEGEGISQHAKKYKNSTNLQLM